MPSYRPNMLLLACISGLTSFSLAILVPALPDLADAFAVSFAEIQLLVSVYLLGLAVSQPLWGHITDTVGRRPVALLGLGIFTLASLASVFGPGLTGLALLRFFQAMGASAATVVARAIIRDTHSREEAAGAMSWISIGLGAAPIVSPMIGGALLVDGDPGYIYLAMGALGLLFSAIMYRDLPETLSPDAPRPRWSGLLSGTATLLSNRGFLGYSAMYGFFQGSFFAFMAVGAAVFQKSFGLGPTIFGAVWGLMGVSYVIGAAAGGRIASGHRKPLLLPITVLASLAIALLLSTLDLMVDEHFLTMIGPIFLMMTLTGAASPLVMAGAVYQVPRLAGTAAGLSSALGMTIGGTFTVVAGHLYAGDFTPIAILISVSAALTVLCWLAIRDR